jgi:hypothetical protein
VPEYVNMIPAAGWRVELSMKDGSTRDAPLVGWALSGHDIALPFFLPPGGPVATELSQETLTGSPGWGIASYRLYHPEERAGDPGRAGHGFYFGYEQEGEPR